MDNINPEKFESRQNPENSQAETREQNRDVSREQREQMNYQGASLLEEPKNGSFVSALQLFAAWVKSVVADDKKDVL
jgi:hypothetical protein